MFLVGVRNLVIEVDARYIKGMLNNPDITPSASVNRWIVSILTFHFELQHIPGKHHGPDGLSRRPPQPDDDSDEEEDSEDKEEFKDWIDNLYGFTHMINQPMHTAFREVRTRPHTRADIQPCARCPRHTDRRTQLRSYPQKCSGHAGR